MENIHDSELQPATTDYSTHRNSCKDIYDFMHMIMFMCIYRPFHHFSPNRMYVLNIISKTEKRLITNLTSEELISYFDVCQQWW